MLETLMIAALGVAYVAACDAEKKEKQRLQKELDEIDCKTDLDIMFFYYAWYNNIALEDVKKRYENGSISFAQLKKCLEEHQ